MFIRLFKGKDWGVMVDALKAKDYTKKIPLKMGMDTFIFSENIVFLKI